MAHESQRFTNGAYLGAALLVTACLVLVPGAAHIPIDFDFAVVRNPIVATVVAICAAFAAAVHLRARLFRGADSAGGPAAAPATKIVVFLVAMSSVVASGGFDAHAQRLVPEFIWRMVTLPVAVAVSTVAGIMLLVRCARRARNTASVGGGAAAARTS